MKIKYNTKKLSYKGFILGQRIKYGVIKSFPGCPDWEELSKEISGVLCHYDSENKNQSCLSEGYQKRGYFVRDAILDSI